MEGGCLFTVYLLFIYCLFTVCLLFIYRNFTQEKCSFLIAIKNNIADLFIGNTPPGWASEVAESVLLLLQVRGWRGLG